MHLTTEEEKMYDGEYGWACQVSTQILTRLGDLFGATKLIPIKSAHLSGVSYKTISDAPIGFLEELANTAGHVKVGTTLNPSSLDPDYPAKVSTTQKEKQRHIIKLYRKMGAEPTLTCTPYYIEQPRQGSHLAWAESSAVIYANSVLGAYTNREGSPSALAAALIGKTPNYGMHRSENRQSTILVDVETELKDEAEFGALGIHLGRLLNDKNPLIKGLSKPSNDDLKQLGAAMATAGMTTIFDTGKPTRRKWEEKVSVGRRDIENTRESVSTISEQPDMVFLGCPHCSLEELKKVADSLKERKVKRGLQLWICVAKWLKERAKGYVEIIEAAGGHVVCDTCAIVTWLRDLGIDSVMTNSAKTAYYAPTMSKVGSSLAPLRECLKTACL